MLFSAYSMPEYLLSHLRQLEAESIAMFREVAAGFQKPVLMYSIGKDSSVLLHLARKAFAPSKVPFPLLHIDTTYKFQEMIRFRDDHVRGELGCNVIVHTNQLGIQQNMNPFDHESSVYIEMMKTDALKQALKEHDFDVAIGGARRDEEVSRAKERVFSVRSSHYGWDPRNQRPELWNLYNTHLKPDQTMRVFPLSNWTELDIWEYILLENIKVVPLYFAKERPVVERSGTLIMVDDHRLPLGENEEPEMKVVRFRTLGCYPLTGAVESKSETVEEIVEELITAKTSERQNRLMDTDEPSSMEEKKRRGYF